MERKYTPEQVARLRETSMEAILRAEGRDDRHTRSGLYFSPFRSEKSPSFHIDDEHHRWADLGCSDPLARKAGQKVRGGDTIDLVMELKGLTFYGALDYLRDFHPEIYVAEPKLIDAGRGSFGPSTIEIREVSDRITSRALLEYGTGVRRIPAEILERYCRQVTYSLVRKDRSLVTAGEALQERSREYWALGFASRSGTWSLRNKYSKLSTGCDYTLVDREGKMRDGEDMAPSSESVVVFEGFFNFLSYLAVRGLTTPRNCDVVVLNSTVNTERALPVILSHRKVMAFYDNDETGRNYSDYLKAECNLASTPENPVGFWDCSGAYGSHNDLNDAWIAQCELREKTAQQEVRTPTQEERPSRRRGLHP